MSDDLIAFLRARLDDDEQIAQATMWDGSDNIPGWYLSASATVETGGDTFYAGDRTVANHIERHDPARVLREVEAKRRILDEYTDALRILDGFRETGWEEGRREALEMACRVLALPYADHHDFRGEWRVDLGQ